MKISCDVIKDILPLYAENMVSNDTKELVDSHICDCDRCKKELEVMSKRTALPMDTDDGSLVRVKKDLKKQKWNIVFRTLLIILALGATLANCLWTPVLLSTEEAFDYMFVNDLGQLCVKFKEGTYSFWVNSAVLAGEDKETFQFYVFTNILDWYYHRYQPDDPGGYDFKVGTGEPDKIARVLFGPDSSLVWGSEPERNVLYIGSMLLPILLIIAAVLAIGLTVLCRRLRDKRHMKHLFGSAVFLWSYVISNLISIKFDFRTYGIFDDTNSIFFLVLFIIQSLLIYGAVLSCIPRPNQAVKNR